MQKFIDNHHSKAEILIKLCKPPIMDNTIAAVFLCYTYMRQEVKTLKEEIIFTAKQVGERIKERRTELNLTMPELGRHIGVNKSTI